MLFFHFSGNCQCIRLNACMDRFAFHYLFELIAKNCKENASYASEEPSGFWGFPLRVLIALDGERWTKKVAFRLQGPVVTGVQRCQTKLNTICAKSRCKSSWIKPNRCANGQGQQQGHGSKDKQKQEMDVVCSSLFPLAFFWNSMRRFLLISSRKNAL